jgi:hypothetical protein
MTDNTNHININIQKFVEKEVRHLWDKVSIILKKNAAALKEARRLMNKRLKEMNEVRAQLDRQVKTFVSTEKHESDIEALNVKLVGLQKLVYVGLGIWLVLSLILVIILKLIP